MKIHLPFALLESSDDLWLVGQAERAGRFRTLTASDLVEIDLLKVPTDTLATLVKIAEADGDARLIRTLDAICRAKGGDFDKSLPNFDAFLPSLLAYLRQGKVRGWLFKQHHDGKLYPYLVVAVMPREPTMRNGDESPSVIIKMLAFGAGVMRGNRSLAARGKDETSVSFGPADVTRKRIPAILASVGYLIETDPLLADYDAQMARFDKEVRGGFAQQFRFDGQFAGRADDSYSPLGGSAKRKVIHDSMISEDDAIPVEAESSVHDETLPVPVHPVVRVFDLSSHDFRWCHSDFLTPYVYDKSLGDKLILPASHRDLLDVMTHDLDAFVGDIVEGKSAGNIILCKGIPGVGKTLTAEIYSELIERPMYAIHSGSLGTSAERIEKNLKTIFARQKRWGCVLLLDEADVFVVQRGGSIEQNAIVAEFLRVLEYFDGLLFMTTNRPDDIDEAIISRCAAIIHYDVPDETNRAKVWTVLMNNYGVAAPPAGLIQELVRTFPTIAPRDTKMLLRLALRVAKAHGEELTVDIFRRCAMFRNVEIAEAAGGPDLNDLV